MQIYIKYNNLCEAVTNCLSVTL